MDWKDVAALSDDELLSSTDAMASRLHRDEAALVAHIAEIDRRKLYCEEACSSTFAYCVERLGLSEDVAYKRIRVARASRRFPEVLARLAAGPGERIHLTGLCLLAPVLCEANAAEVLGRAAGKNKREIEKLVAELAPRPDVPDSIRRLPQRRAVPRVEGASANAEANTGAAASAGKLVPEPVSLAPPPAPKPARIEPLSPDRYRLQLTADQALLDNIEAARDLLSHRIPDRDLARVIAWAMALAVKELRKQRFAMTDRPRASAGAVEPGSRHVPSPVKREIFVRDEGRCAYVDARGRRCKATALLEIHHHDPHARGGPPTPENLSLRCRAHNQRQAELDFGAQFMERKRRRPRGAESRA